MFGGYFGKVKLWYRNNFSSVFSQHFQSGPGVCGKMWIVSSLLRLMWAGLRYINPQLCRCHRQDVSSFFFSSIYCDLRRFDPAHFTLISLHCAKKNLDDSIQYKYSSQNKEEVMCAIQRTDFRILQAVYPGLSLINSRQHQEWDNKLPYWPCILVFAVMVS